MPLGNLNLGHLGAHADSDVNKAVFPHEATGIKYDGGNVGDTLDTILASIKPFATTLVDPALNAITQSMIDDNGGVVITLTGAGNDQTLPSPTDTTPGKTRFTVINNDSSTHPINIIGGLTIVLDPGKKVQFIWEGTSYAASEAEGILLDNGTDIYFQNSTRNFKLLTGKYLAGDNLEIYEEAGTGDGIFINTFLNNTIRIKKTGEIESGVPNTAAVEELKNASGDVEVRLDTIGDGWHMNNFGLGTRTPNTKLDIQGGQTVKVTTVNAATYNLLNTDYIIHDMYSTTNPSTRTLPSAQTVSGRVIYIKDAGGNAGVNSITINTEGGETIDGNATFVMNSNYESDGFYSDGTNWFVI